MHLQTIFNSLPITLSEIQFSGLFKTFLAKKYFLDYKTTIHLRQNFQPAYVIKVIGAHSYEDKQKIKWTKCVHD